VYRRDVPRQGAPGRILIVEHDTTDGAIARHFEALGWDVVQSATVREAIDAAMRVPPDVVIVSLDLPDVAGHQLARSFRSIVDHDIVVIALSHASASTADVLRAGFDAVFDEPYDLDQLARAAANEHKLTAKMPRLIP
jgi:DNA-binding response OmpR family regulator